MFWFKTKKIVVDCFTSDPFAFEYAGISPAIKHFPEWWLDLPKLDQNRSTMKSCKGFTSLFKQSFIIPAWANYRFQVGSVKDKTFNWFTNIGSPDNAKPSNILDIHHKHEYGDFIGNNYQHVKLYSPWFMKTNRFVNFYFNDVVWNKKDLLAFSVLPGIIDFKYQHHTNVNLVFQYEDEPKEFFLSVGEPLVSITPLSEYDVELKNHLVDNLEIIRQVPFFRLKNGPKIYQRNKKFIQDHEVRTESKCPFGF